MKLNSWMAIIFFLPVLLSAQEKDLSFFEPLMNKVWHAEGSWGDGSTFKQSIRFEYGLNEKIVIAKSDGFTNEERSEYGPRNYGIRKYDPTSDQYQFWEFDIFGGTTSGEFRIEGKNIIYQYSYGESVVTDLWEYVDPLTYNFTVGDYQDGEWKQKYLSTQFKVQPVD